MEVNLSTRFKGPGPKSCGCKGTRSCFLCDPHLANQRSNLGDPFPLKQQEITRDTYEYCIACGKAWLVIKNHNENVTDDPKENVDAQNKETERANGHMHHQQQCCHETPSSTCIDFPGIHIFEEFVSEDEEIYLDEEISKTAFANSQSGRRKQDFGPKVNFKKQKLKTAGFSGLPSYSKFLYERMMSNSVLANFRPVEMCNLEYLDERGAHIDPHYDDFWLWGERLVTVNLCSPSFLTFTIDSQPNISVRIPMPRRSLIVVCGPARHEWKHSIQMKDIHGKRIAITFRELSSEFQEVGARHEEGKALEELALTFEGCAVGS